MHTLLATSATWLPMLLAQETQGDPGDMRSMLSGVRLIAIVALIFMVAILVWVIKKL